MLKALVYSLFQALRADVVLQIAYLFRHCDDSLSEGEIIPFSGVSKSEAGSIAQAGMPTRWPPSPVLP